MGTTINGVFTGGKQGRRQRALLRLKENISKTEKQIKELGVSKKSENILATPLLLSLARMTGEENTLVDRLSGKKKQVVVKDEKTGIEVPKQRYFIDIFSIQLGYVKRTERKKNKGKSRKKMRKQKSVSFVRSVIMQPGMLDSFREGRMGVSPKSHTFRVRREEPTLI